MANIRDETPKPAKPKPLPEREAVEGRRRLQWHHVRQLKQTAKDICFSIEAIFNKEKPILCRFASANGLLKTNIKIRLDYDLKFSNLEGTRIITALKYHQYE